MPRNVIKVKNPFGDTLYGYAWTCSKPKANVLIFTGMQETAIRYDSFANYLNEHHYDVYCLDHYGQGLNINKGENYGIWPASGFSKMVQSFGELANQLSATGLDNYVFGHSMGSFMVQEYIQRYNRYVGKAIICGSDCANPVLMGCAYRFARIITPKWRYDFTSKFLAGLVTGPFAKAVPNRRTDFDWLSYNKANVDKYIADPLCGFTATAGFYTEFLKGMRRIGRKKFLRKVHKTIHLLIIAGAEDPVGHMGKGPTKLANTYKEFGIRDVNLKIYPKMRHEILNEDDHLQVYKDVVEFLNKK
ncbi:MAG: lysophospholipase [Bacilli bacterium]|nr:lysophospholipase [Bacilli bacterium]